MSTRRRLPPALLPDDIVEKIVLRFPADDPAFLLSAALVCKDWCRVICGPDFRRRFREFHRNPPLLGIIYRSVGISACRGGWIKQTQFMPTSTFCLPTANMSRWRAMDALHGRILFCDLESSRGPLEWTEFVVWSPVPSDVQRLPALPLRRYSWSAALLCATAGCDHLDCSSGAFAVAFVGTDSIEGLTSAYVYTSEQHEWSMPISIEDRSVEGIKRPSARVGNTVYFICQKSTKLLAYELCKQELSVISTPSTCRDYSFTAFTTEDEGRFWFASAESSKLFTWSREAGLDW
ncbi:hypothetical protein EJB05_40816, partial [Eragrostis curvula]